METYDLSMHSGSNVADFSYVEQMRYFQYLQEQMQQENELNAYISECLCLSEGTFNEFQALHEAITDKVSNAWEKILDFLRRMWGKFSESMNNLFDNNKEYLNQYRDIILNRPPKFAQSIDMNDCKLAINRMMKIQLQPVNSAILGRIPKSDKEANEEGQLNRLRTTVVQEWNNGKPAKNPDDKEFAQWLSDYFKGADNPLTGVSMSDLNMREIFDFCYTADKNGAMMKALQKDKDVVEKNSKEFIDEIKKIAPAGNTNKDTKTTGETGTGGTGGGTGGTGTGTGGTGGTGTGTGTGGTGTGTGTGGGAKPAGVGESFVFSNVVGSYINESYFTEEIKMNNPGNNAGNSASTQTATPATDSGNTALGSQKSRTDQKEKDAEANKGELEDIKKANDVRETQTQLSYQANVYSQLGTDICTAKMNGVTAVYNDYMQIIRAHVRSYVGNEKAAERRPAQQSQNYNDVQDNRGEQRGANAREAKGESATILNEGWGAWFSWLFSPYGLGKPLVYDNISRSNFEKIQNKPELVKAINKLAEPVVREAKRGNKNLSEKAPSGISDFRKNWTPHSIIDYLFKGAEKGVFNDKNYKYDMFFLFDTEEIIGVYVILYDTERNVPVKFTVPVPSKKQYSQYA